VTIKSRIMPAPLGQESVTEGGGSSGHGVAFCVRLCDGQHFPREPAGGKFLPSSNRAAETELGRQCGQVMTSTTRIRSRVS
jgi:hypothetical protein